MKLCRSIASTLLGIAALCGLASPGQAQLQFVQQGSKLVGSGVVPSLGYSSYQGYAVAISADGNTAVSGGPFDNGSNGATWVFTRSGGVWNQQGSKLVGSGAAGTAIQGILFGDN